MSIADTIESMQTNLANAYNVVETKGGTLPANKNLENLANAINSIQGGGGGGGTTGNDVILYDPYGEKIASYSKSDFLNLSAYPTAPTLTGLTFQEYNWTLADAKIYVTTYGKLNIGATYTTTSGLTEFDIELTQQTGKTVTFAMEGTVNWGDGTIETISGSTTHTYADYGNYTITSNGTRLPQYCMGQTSSTVNYTLKNVKIGNFVSTSGSAVFRNCYSLTNITIPSGITSFGNGSFYNCYSLTNITIPSGVTSIISNLFQNCYSLTNITIPKSVTRFSSSAFSYCHSLNNITIPSGVTSLGSSAFSYCYSLTNITIPSGVTSIESRAFTSCCSLTNITIPSGVTSFDVSVFAACFSIMKYDFTSATSVPNLITTSAFNGINGICKIVVPDNLYSTWTTATNWSTYANYIYKASEV